MHYSTWLSGYKRPYADGPVDLTEVHGGGVIAATFEQLVQVNGWSNLFYGWGGEDDEFGGRTRCVFGEYPIEWGSAALHGDQCAFVHMEDRSSGECPCFVWCFSTHLHAHCSSFCPLFFSPPGELGAQCQCRVLTPTSTTTPRSRCAHATKRRRTASSPTSTTPW